MSLGVIPLCILAAYIVIGLCAAAAFVTRGVTQVAPHNQFTLGARIVLFPGAAALWPYVLFRWLKARSGA